jgi:hypothetical protein
MHNKPKIMKITDIHNIMKIIEIPTH